MPKAFNSAAARKSKQSKRGLEDSMNSFLFCALIFICSFLAIWAFWFVEKLRGDSAPQVVDLTAHRRR
jgi:hypothetical protein